MRCGHCKQQDVNIDHVRSHTMDTPDPQRPPNGYAAPEPRDTPPADTAKPWYGGNGGKPLPFPPGRYAILVPAPDEGPDSSMQDEVRFYHIDAPDEGRWRGYVFVKRQAGDELYPVKGRAGTAVIDQIAREPEEAMLRYGREIGKCGHCGRTLTNEESRALGIGPICRGKVSF